MNTSETYLETNENASLLTSGAPAPKKAQPVRKRAKREIKTPDNRQYDSGSVGWSLLGIFADPIWAFIVYLCWKDQKPRCAKKALIGAIIGAVIRIIFIAWIVISFINFTNELAAYAGTLYY